MMGSPVRVRRKRKVGKVQWRPPDPRWIKLNVDGAFLAASVKAGCGGVVMDNKGKILSVFCAGLECESSLEAEVSAFLMGITLAKELGGQLWIESDAETVVRWLEAEQLGTTGTCIVLAKVRRDCRVLHGKFLTSLGRGINLLIFWQRWDCELECRLCFRECRPLPG